MGKEICILNIQTSDYMLNVLSLADISRKCQQHI
jgi:hypothetical protein